MTVTGARGAVARLAEMVGRPRLLLSIALGAVCVLALAACGSDEDVGEIPSDSSGVMRAALADAEAAHESDPRDCETIAESASAVANEASGLPESPVRTAVIAAAENLDELAKSEACGPTTTGEQGPEDEDQTTTTPPTTTTTTTTEPPEDDDDDNGGNGRNGGNGGNGGGGGPPQQPPNEGGGGLGGGNQGGQPPPDTGGTGGGTGPG